MAGTFADLLLLLRADSTDLDEKLKGAGDNINNLADAATKGGAKLLEGLSFAELTKEAFDTGNTFEDAFSKIERATGAVGEPLQGLEASFAATFGNVVQGADDVAGGLALLSQRTGATGDDLNKLVDINSKLAQVLDQQLTPTVESTQKVFAAFKTALQDQPATLDALLAIAQKSGVSFNTLIGGLQNIGPTLRAMGLDVTDSAALLANFEEQGINTGKVAGTLNASLVSLANEGFVDPKAALGDFLQKIIDAKDPTEALELAAENLKGKGMIPLVDALQNGAGNLAILRDAAANSKGKIEETAASTQTLSEKFTLLEGATTKLLAPVGVDLVAALSKLVDAGTGVVKFIDTVGQKADDLDKKFGTDTEHISGFAQLFDIMAKAIAEKAIPGLKSLSDEAANNKFIDGSMANGLKTLSDMLAPLGTNTSDAQAKFEALDKELQAAEKNLSDVEKAVRLGVGTDQDAAAARLKVVAATQALHPELKSVFTETDEWDSALAISRGMIFGLGDDLQALAPTISASTALLESQAVSLQARAGLWQLDMQGIQDDAAALTASSDVLSGHIANMKGFDEVLKLVQTGLTNQLKGIQQVTEGFGPLHDAQLLGINDGSVLKTRMDDMHDAFIRATSAVDDQGRAVYSLHQQAIAQIADLQSQIAYHQSLGVNTDDLQLKVIHLTDAVKTQNAGFVDTVTAMHNIITSGFDTALDNLITGAGSVADAFTKMGESLVTTFANRILNDALKPVENELDTLIDQALKAAENLLKIPSLASSIPTGTGGIPGLNLPPTTISDIPTLPAPGGGIPGVNGQPGIDTGAGGGGVSSVGSSLLGSISGVVSAVGSIATAIGTFVEGGAMNDKLFKILNDTDRMDLILEKSGNETIFYYTKQIWQILDDIGAPIQGTLYDIRSALQTSQTFLLDILTIMGNPLPDLLTPLNSISEAMGAGFAAIEGKLDTINQSVSSLKLGGVNVAATVNPTVSQPLQINSVVNLDAQELFQSFVTWMDQNGKVIPGF